MPSLTRRSTLKALAMGTAGVWGASLTNVGVAQGTTRSKTKSKTATKAVPRGAPRPPANAAPSTEVGRASAAVWRFPVGGYGPLLADPKGLMDLPAGFRYVVLAAPGETTMADGSRIPARPDAMGSFTVGSTIVIAINHELSADDGDAVPRNDANEVVASYDRTLGGGVSLITMDTAGRAISHRAALTGTARNCAGGITPWGTWLTCEESEVTVNGTPHGYVFEIDPTRTQTDAVPYKAMGRFPHEAAAVDPQTSEVYLTEDNGGNALLYKFVPTDRSQRFGSLGRGGTLFALRVPGVANLGSLTQPGSTVSGVGWTPVPNPNGVDTPQDVIGLKNLFPDTSVTRAQKLEGAWFHDGLLTFISSFNESISQPILRHEGQVFQYDPRRSTLTLLAYLPVGGRQEFSNETLSRPDNVSVSRFGGVVWCEDGIDPNGIGGLDGNGTPFAFARSREPGELCGVHFSPDGTWLFVNQQVVGRTLAITGPWTPTTKASTTVAGNPNTRKPHK